jgi:hypothetical protein
MALHNFVYDDAANVKHQRRSGGGGGGGGDRQQKAPSFHADIKKNHTVQLGGTAHLPCRVIDVGNRSVSNIRQNRDGIHQIVSRFLERFRYMCPLLFSCVLPS